MIGRTFFLLLDPIVTKKIEVVHFITLSQMVSAMANVGFGTNNNQRYGIELHRTGFPEAYSKS